MNKVELARAVVEGMKPKWVKAPEGSLCPDCGEESLERSVILMGGPFSGSVRCTSCEYTNTVMNHLAKTCIKVEPLDPLKE